MINESIIQKTPRNLNAWFITYLNKFSFSLTHSLPSSIFLQLFSARQIHFD